MILTFLTVFSILMHFQTTSQVSDFQKQEFIQLIKELPTKHEFYAEEAITKAEPYLPVLLALTEKDIDKYDIYPFAAISRGLCDRKENRDYVVRHFKNIAHPKIRLFWGAMLFTAGDVSTEIVQFLQSALESKEQAKLLSEMIGPRFEVFKRRVMTTTVEH